MLTGVGCPPHPWAVVCDSIRADSSSGAKGIPLEAGRGDAPAWSFSAAGMDSAALHTPAPASVPCQGYFVFPAEIASSLPGE